MPTATPAPAAAPSAAPAPAASHAETDRSLFHGIAWTGGVKWASQALTWASTFVVARILTPEDYGIVGMAAVFLGLITMLGEFGLGAAVVTLRTLAPSQVRQLNTLSVLLGGASFLAACAAAAPMAAFFGTPELVAVVPVLGLGFLAAGFRTVPESALQRELAFRTLALMEGGQAVAVAAATVAFALAGLGYWTLVLGTLLGGVLSAGLAVAWRPHGFERPRAASIRPALTFSGHVLAARLAWYVYANADFLVVGRVLGERALGFYSFAWSLASVPIGKVSALILRVTPAHFAAVQEDRAALRRYFLTLTEGLAIATFPATVGLALVADDFVRVLLGEKWAAAVPVLRLLALYASFRSITPLLPQLLNVTGDARFAMRNGIAAAVLLPTAFLAGTRWGPAGVAVAWMLVHPLCIVPLYARVFRRLEMGPGAYLRALWPAASACALMAAAVGLAARLTGGQPGAFSLAAQVATGAAAYAAAVLALHGARVRAFRAAVRGSPAG